MQSLIRHLNPTRSLTCHNLPRTTLQLSLTTRRHFAFSAPKYGTTLKPIQFYLNVSETTKHLLAKDVITASPNKDAGVQDAIAETSSVEGSSSPPLHSFQMREKEVNGHENYMNEFGPKCPAIFPVSTGKPVTETIKRSVLRTIAITVFKGVCVVFIVVGALAYINWGWILAQENLLRSLFWPFGPFPPTLEIGGYSVVVERSNQGKMEDFMESFASFVKAVRLCMIYMVISGTLVAFFLEVLRFAQGL